MTTVTHMWMNPPAPHAKWKKQDTKKPQLQKSQSWPTMMDISPAVSQGGTRGGDQAGPRGGLLSCWKHLTSGLRRLFTHFSKLISLHS